MTEQRLQEIVKELRKQSELKELARIAKKYGLVVRTGR